ncbi:MAG: hypothetical protein RKO25_11020, partial [Candidatus Contendobacter sp.]|nr:hypothetical protein [Candidatus Contendobacter sp.]
ESPNEAVPQATEAASPVEALETHGECSNESPNEAVPQATEAASPVETTTPALETPPVAVEATVSELESVAPTEAGELPVERVVTGVVAEQPDEGLLQSDAGATETPVCLTPDVVAAAPPSEEESAAVPLASEAEPVTTTTVADTDAPDISPPTESAEAPAVTPTTPPSPPTPEPNAENTPTS